MTAPSPPSPFLETEDGSDFLTDDLGNPLDLSGPEDEDQQ